MAKKQRYPKTIESAVVTEKNGTLKERLKALDSDLALKAPVANPTLTGTPKAPTPGSSSNDTQIATTAFVNSQISSKIAAADAMIYKGTIGTGGTVTSLPAAHTTGWTYKVITAGTYAGQKCEIGDMIICLTTGTTANDSHWTVIQTNIDGAVIGPNSAVSDRIATFNGTTGKVIKDGGLTLSQLVQTSRKVTAGTGLTGGGALSSDVALSHQAKPTAGTDAGGSGSVVTGVTIDTMGHVVSTTKGNITSVTGNAGTATKLQTARTLNISAPGMLSAGVPFDGSADAAIKFKDGICIDLSGAGTENAVLKSAFGSDGYWRPRSSITGLVVNSVIGGPDFHVIINTLNAVNWKAYIYLGNNDWAQTIIKPLDDAIYGCIFFHYNQQFTLQLKVVSQDDGGTVEMVIIKNIGMTSEFPDIPATTGSWATLDRVVHLGYRFYDVMQKISYEYDGIDWLYESYVTL